MAFGVLPQDFQGPHLVSPMEKKNPWRLHWIRVVVNVADLTHTAIIPLISIQTADIELCRPLEAASEPG